METAAIRRSFHGAILPNQKAAFFHEKAPISRGAIKVTSFSRSLGSSKVSHRGSIVPFVKASETAPSLTSDVASEKTSEGPLENNCVQKSTFPDGFEALILNVCDETSIAELKLKVGAFEMHLKRGIGNPIAPVPAAPAITEPMPSKPIAAQPLVPQKSAPASNSPFANVSSSKVSKLAMLEASGAKSYVLVSSHTVGTFRSGITLKGITQPPSCKEGDIIKAGQTIGYLDQFSRPMPIKSDVDGEVLKFLVKDGETIGYGDPLIAVLPYFHEIE